MNSKHRTWLLVVFALTLISCDAQRPVDAVIFLEGTWKMENKDTYEQWQLTDAEGLEGHSFKRKDGNKRMLETLKIRTVDGRLVYDATVPNQNEGQTISFWHNEQVKDCISFENLDHDFPKKIQYKKIDEQTLLVRVLGAEDKGFSYRLIKE